MAYPAPLMPKEKSFLSRLFGERAGLKASYTACEAMVPSQRPRLLHEMMIHARREVWADYGVKEGNRETIANHVDAMKSILGNISLPDNIDFFKVQEMCDVWGMVRAVTGEPSHDKMNAEDRLTLGRLGAGLAFEDPSQRHFADTWHNLNGAKDASGYVSSASQYFHDLDFMATARWARILQTQSPQHYKDALAPLIAHCEKELILQHSRLQFHKAINEFPGSWIGNPLQVAIDNGDKPADSNGKAAVRKPEEPQKYAM